MPSARRIGIFSRVGRGVVNAWRGAARWMLRASYRGADMDRLSGSWGAKNKSADGHLIPELGKLIPRARDLVRNDPIAKSGVRSYRRNVVGRTGIMPVPTCRRPDGTLDEEWNKAARESFRRWAKSPKRCDRERKRSFTMFQRWGVSELTVPGGALIVLCEVEVPGGTDLALQPFEVDQLDMLKLSHTDDKGITREVRGGIEIDEYGAAVAYHLAPAIVADMGLKFSSQSHRILAERVVHIFDPERARQTRGEGRVVCVLQPMWNLTEYDRAQLQAARAEANIGLVITSEEGAVDTKAVDADGKKKAADDDIDLAPVSTFRGRPGETIEGFVPRRPGNLYEPLTKVQTKRIAAGMGLSYQGLMRDYSDTTYSGGRQGMLDDYAEFDEVVDLLVATMCEPIYQRKIELDVMWGRLKRPEAWVSDREGCLECNWMQPARPWVDPRNEAQALSTGLDHNLTTLEEIHATRGRDYRDVLKQRQLEREEERKLGIEPREANPAPDEPPAPQAKPEKTTQPTDEGDDE